MKKVAMLVVTIAIVCTVFIANPWAAGVPDLSQQLKALRSDVEYKITDIVGKKIGLTDPNGVKTTLEGVNTKGLKVGDVLKGSELQKMLGQSSTPAKGALADSIPKGLK